MVERAGVVPLAVEPGGVGQAVLDRAAEDGRGVDLPVGLGHDAPVEAARRALRRGAVVFGRLAHGVDPLGGEPAAERRVGGEDAPRVEVVAFAPVGEPRVVVEGHGEGGRGVGAETDRQVEAPRGDRQCVVGAVAPVEGGVAGQDLAREVVGELCGDRRDGAFERQQAALGIHAAGVSRQRAVAAHHAVARYEDRQRVAVVGRPHGAARPRPADLRGDLRIGAGGAVGDRLQRPPDLLPEGRPVGGERQGELPPQPREVFVDLPCRLAQQGCGRGVGVGRAAEVEAHERPVGGRERQRPEGRAEGVAVGHRCGVFPKDERAGRYARAAPSLRGGVGHDQRCSSV